MLRDLWYRLRALSQPSRVEAEIADELRFHLDQAQSKLTNEGLDPPEARRRAGIAFGGFATAAEACRDARGVGLLTDTAADVRYALRSLRGAPLVTAVALLSLTLGIGANTALFSIVDSLLLRSLPVAEPERLVQLEGGSWTNPIWEQIRARQHELFDGAFAWSQERFDLAQGGETQFVDGAYASGRMFAVLGVQPALGRLLSEADDARGGGGDGAAVVISHRFWQRHFGGAADVVGRPLTLERVPFTIVGVMPAGFFGPDVGRACDVVIAIGAEPLIRGAESFLDGRSNWWLEIMARLKPGQTVEQATAAIRGIQPLVREATMPPQYPPEIRAEYLSSGFSLTPAASGASQLRSTYEQPLVAVMVVVAIVLVIACANIASLMLARATARRRELSVRLALGASRWRLIRQLLIESLLLAAGGAVLGLVFARWSSALLVQQLSSWRSTVFLDLTIDWRVLAFTAGISAVTVLLFGVAPALGGTRIQPNEAIREGARGIAGDRNHRFRNGFVIVQVALSVTLVVAAGLFLRTFASLASVPLGFSPERLLVAEVNLLPSVTPASERGALANRLREAVTLVPGVRHAAASFITPLTGAGWNTGIGEDRADNRERMSWVNAVSPGFFETYGTPIIAGRDFTAADRPGGPVVAIVNEAFARHFFPGTSPVGQVIESRTPSEVEIYQVVGVVGDSVYRSLREGPVRTLYLAIGQQERQPARVSIAVASTGPPASVAHTVGDALRSVDPTAAFTLRTLDHLADATIARERLVAVLSGFFGGLALLLAGVGLYGVTAYGVTRRRMEIGVRMALGARPSGIVALVLRGMSVLLVSGLLLGGAMAFWAARYTETLLFNLEPRDPLTFGAAALALVLVGLTAAWLPASRAARIDPAAVLRE
jgi:predicted permease